MALFIDTPAIASIKYRPFVVISLFSVLKKKFKLIFEVDVNIERDYNLIMEEYVTFRKKNNLAEARPDLLLEWDYDKNGAVNPSFVSQHSNKKFWWICYKCKSSYQMMVNNRTGYKKSGCPYCSNKLIEIGKNDLFSTDPELIDEWDYNKNDIDPTSIKRGSHKEIWWCCKNGHSWRTKVYVRTIMGCGCPKCRQK